MGWKQAAGEEEFPWRLLQNPGKAWLHHAGDFEVSGRFVVVGSIARINRLDVENEEKGEI